MTTLSIMAQAVATFALAAAVPAPTHRAAYPQAALLEEFAKTVPHVSRASFVLDWHDRRYRIFLSLPTGKPPDAGFPVIYVTDANGLFDIAAQVAHNEAYFQRKSKVEPAVIVGIGYDTDMPFPPMRLFDLTTPEPTATGHGSIERNGHAIETGGADELLDMIEQRVRPEVARRIAVDRGRQALFGHSLGGLFVLHTLFTRPQMFQVYIAASPAIWWREHFLLSEEKAFEQRAREGAVKGRLLITVGALETPSESEGKDPKFPNMVKDARAMRDALAAIKAPGLSLQFREYEGEDHLSVIPAAIDAAVRFAVGQPR